MHTVVNDDLLHFLYINCLFPENSDGGVGSGSSTDDTGKNLMRFILFSNTIVVTFIVAFAVTFQLLLLLFLL